MSNNTSPCRESFYTEALLRELRASHAGETGAVWIYRGILSARSKDLTLNGFAKQHLETEQQHLALLSALTPQTQQSKLLFLWRLAAFLTGWIPAIFSSNAVYHTIEAIETFVEAHYLEQLELPMIANNGAVSATFTHCLRDEVAHKAEAALHARPSSGLLLSAWLDAVTIGSSVAVQLARRI